MSKVLEPEHPAISRFCRKLRLERGLDQMIGMCQGVLADGYISTEEAATLHAWLRGNWEIREQWPANVLLARLDEALADGVLSDEENLELLRTILRLTGGIEPERPEARSTVTTLPLDEPAPVVDFTGRGFVLTGTFAIGKRSHCEKLVISHGGRVQGAPSKRTHFLVVGCLGSENWLHSSFGTKIQVAMDLRSGGHPLAIVSEQHWASHLREVEHA